MFVSVIGNAALSTPSNEPLMLARDGHDSREFCLIIDRSSRSLSVVLLSACFAVPSVLSDLAYSLSSHGENRERSGDGRQRSASERGGTRCSPTSRASAINASAELKSRQRISAARTTASEYGDRKRSAFTHTGARRERTIVRAAQCHALRRQLISRTLSGRDRNLAFCWRVAGTSDDLHRLLPASVLEGETGTIDLAARRTTRIRTTAASWPAATANWRAWSLSNLLACLLLIRFRSRIACAVNAFSFARVCFIVKLQLHMLQPLCDVRSSSACAQCNGDRVTWNQTSLSTAMYGTHARHVNCSLLYRVAHDRRPPPARASICTPADSIGKAPLISER